MRLTLQERSRRHHVRPQPLLRMNRRILEHPIFSPATNHQHPHDEYSPPDGQTHWPCNEAPPQFHGTLQDHHRLQTESPCHTANGTDLYEEIPLSSKLHRPGQRNPRSEHPIKSIQHSLEPTPQIQQRCNRGVAIHEHVATVMRIPTLLRALRTSRTTFKTKRVSSGAPLPHQTTKPKPPRHSPYVLSHRDAKHQGLP